MRGKILFIKDESSPMKTLGYRLLFIFVILCLIAIAFWLDREGLEDTRDGEISPTDVIYFTAITITTTGYGDIHPNSTFAMLFDSFVATPMRAIIWLIFIGTAYQLVIQQFVEERRMRKLQKDLVNHVIVAGYGMTGKAVAKELVAKEYERDQIIIIDNNKDAISDAASDDFIGLLGDASQEASLNRAVISKAKYIIIATSRDDTNVLICLTVKDMNENITIIARANQEENTKLLKRSGANIIISPSVAGGRIMAAATHHEHLALLLEDMLTAEHGIRLSERAVKESEIGKRPKELIGMIVIGVHRKKKFLEVRELDTTKLQSGDIIILLEKPA